MCCTQLKLWVNYRWIQTFSESCSAQTQAVLCNSQGHRRYRLPSATESHLNACGSSTCRHKLKKWHIYCRRMLLHLQATGNSLVVCISSNAGKQRAVHFQPRPSETYVSYSGCAKVIIPLNTPSMTLWLEILYRSISVRCHHEGHLIREIVRWAFRSQLKRSVAEIVIVILEECKIYFHIGPTCLSVRLNCTGTTTTFWIYCNFTVPVYGMQREWQHMALDTLISMHFIETCT